MPCAGFHRPAVIFFCLSFLFFNPPSHCSLLGSGKAPYPQGTETSAWHPKNAIAGFLRPGAAQGLRLNYSRLVANQKKLIFKAQLFR